MFNFGVEMLLVESLFFSFLFVAVVALVIFLIYKLPDFLDARTLSSKNYKELVETVDYLLERNGDMNYFELADILKIHNKTNLKRWLYLSGYSFLGEMRVLPREDSKELTQRKKSV